MHNPRIWTNCCSVVLRPIVAILFLVSLLPEVAHAQGATGGAIASAKRIPENELLPKLVPVGEVARFGYSQALIVQGETAFTSGAVLVASEIRFRPGGKLVLSASPGQGNRERAVYLVTRRIVVEPGAQPAIVTWAGSRIPISEPPPAGKAAPGAAGYDGSPGSKGQNGTTGNNGTVGRTPPMLYIATREIDGKLTVDWRGQDGGPGGTGQDGGDGGHGGAGRPASASLFDCRRGPGDGGAGGDGGDGGIGGSGGRGGDGGMFVLLAMPGDIPGIVSRISLDKASGTGGLGGAGGKYGAGGPGGTPGRPAPPFCRADGRVGAAGRDGMTGASQADKRGQPGLPGEIAVGELTEMQARAIGIVQ